MTTDPPFVFERLRRWCATPYMTDNPRREHCEHRCVSLSYDDRVERRDGTGRSVWQIRMANRAGWTPAAERPLGACEHCSGPIPETVRRRNRARRVVT